MPMQIFWGVEAVYYGIVQVGNEKIHSWVSFAFLAEYGTLLGGHLCHQSEIRNDWLVVQYSQQLSLVIPSVLCDPRQIVSVQRVPPKGA